MNKEEQKILYDMQFGNSDKHANLKIKLLDDLVFCGISAFKTTENGCEYIDPLSDEFNNVLQSEKMKNK